MEKIRENDEESKDKIHGNEILVDNRSIDNVELAEKFFIMRLIDLKNLGKPGEKPPKVIIAQLCDMKALEKPSDHSEIAKILEIIFIFINCILVITIIIKVLKIFHIYQESYIPDPDKKANWKTTVSPEDATEMKKEFVINIVSILISIPQIIYGLFGLKSLSRPFLFIYLIFPAVAIFFDLMKIYFTSDYLVDLIIDSSLLVVWLCFIDEVKSFGIFHHLFEETD